MASTSMSRFERISGGENDLAMVLPRLLLLMVHACSLCGDKHPRFGLHADGMRRRQMTGGDGASALEFAS